MLYLLCSIRDPLKVARIHTNRNDETGTESTFSYSCLPSLVEFTEPLPLRDREGVVSQELIGRAFHNSVRQSPVPILGDEISKLLLPHAEEAHADGAHRATTVLAVVQWH